MKGATDGKAIVVLGNPLAVATCGHDRVPSFKVTLGYRRWGSPANPPNGAGLPEFYRFRRTKRNSLPMPLLAT